MTRFMTSDGFYVQLLPGLTSILSKKHHECGIRKCGIPRWKLTARPFQEGIQNDFPWVSFSLSYFLRVSSIWTFNQWESPCDIGLCNLCCSETHHHIHKAQTLCCQPGNEVFKMEMQMKINASGAWINSNFGFIKKTPSHHFKVSLHLHYAENTISKLHYTLSKCIGVHLDWRKAAFGH